VHLTDRTDFSLRVLLFLAVHDGERVVVRQVADAFGVSAAHLAKCVQALGHAGFVTTTAGRTGGVALARPADQVSLGAVVRALEPMALVECFGSENQCPIVSVCGLTQPLGRAGEAFLRELDGVTLADAARPRAALRRAMGSPSDS
jgi:Rrf2 family nitric oxide-sensitive transcriptional repressor